MKLCTDFKLPAKKNYLMDLFKRKVQRDNAPLDYLVFKDCLYEIFRSYSKDTLKQKEKERKELTQKIDKYQKQQY